MNYLFCATCQTFGPIEGDIPPDAHAGHRDTIVAHDNPDVDIARLFVGWLRVQREYIDNPAWAAECEEFGCHDPSGDLP